MRGNYGKLLALSNVFSYLVTMLYIKRDENSKIIGISNQKITDDKSTYEAVDISKRDVRDFLKQEGISLKEAASASFETLDLELVRVLEDLIYVLVDKNVLTLADLPSAAVKKLGMRVRAREHLGQLGDFVQDDEGIL